MEWPRVMDVLGMQVGLVVGVAGQGYRRASHPIMPPKHFPSRAPPLTPPHPRPLLPPPAFSLTSDPGYQCHKQGALTLWPQPPGIHQPRARLLMGPKGE